MLFRSSSLAILLVAAALVGTVYCNENWICVKTSLGNVNSTFIDEYIGNGQIDKSRCGEVCAAKGHSSKTWIGYVGAIVAIIFFGTNFIPVKKFDTGDGMFFQWVLCVGIWLVGLVVNLIRHQPPFYYPALIGGFLWTFGNIFTVSIIKMIGLTMGLTVWGATNLMAGWITGKFIIGQDLACSPLNYGGVACVLMSTVILAFVKSEGKKMDGDANKEPTESSALINTSVVNNGERSSLMGSLKDKILNRSKEESNSPPLTFSSRKNFIMGTTNDMADEDSSWVDKLGKWPRRITGFTLALFVGFFFGSQFLPVEYMRLCDDEIHSCSELDYIFGHYTGILLSSTLWFIIYCVVMKNKPQVYPKIIIPGLISGIMWGIAMVGWFLANQYISLAVSFPIVTAGPGFVSSALGILVFREIKGWVNIVLYFAGFSVSLAGLVLVGLSNCTHCKY